MSFTQTRPYYLSQEPNRLLDFMSQPPRVDAHAYPPVCPRGIPASYRHMDGSDVNTFNLVNPEGNTFLVKYHFHPHCAVAGLTAEKAAKVQGQGQGQGLGSASKDLYEFISTLSGTCMRQ